MTKNQLVRSAVALGCLYHMAAVLAHNLPTDTALGSPRAPFAAYASLTWVYQAWSMFHTIPYYVALRPALVASYADGKRKAYGAKLPGLTRLESTPRAAYLTLRTTAPTDEYIPFANYYLARACDEIAKLEHKRPISVAMRLHAVRITSLAEVRKTKRIGRHVVEWSKWHRC